MTSAGLPSKDKLQFGWPSAIQKPLIEHCDWHWHILSGMKMGVVSTQSELTTLPHLKAERLKIANQRTYSFRLCPGTKKLGLSRNKRGTEQTEQFFSKRPAANLCRAAQRHHKGLQGLQWRVARSCGVWALPEMVIHNASDPVTIGGILWPHQVVKNRVLRRPCIYDDVWCCMVLWPWCCEYYIQIYIDIHDVMMFVLYYVRLLYVCTVCEFLFAGS